MRWRIYDEAVQMIRRRFQFFPEAFCWRGRQFRVQEVQRSWVVTRPGWRQPVERRYYQVQCTSGTFEIYQDLRAGTWHLRRARLHPARIPPALQLAAA